MKILVAILSGVLVLVLLTGKTVESRASGEYIESLPADRVSEIVQTYCVTCHSERLKTGNLVLAGYSLDSSLARLGTTEKMIRKLRAEMMPPPRSRRPEGDTLLALARTLEAHVDASLPPNPGSRPFQRLNRPEYERAIFDLLGLRVNAAEYLPLDTKSANFDNIADVQALSPTLLDAYLAGASAVSRLALGNKDAAALSTSYGASIFASQHPWNLVPGAPYGTRGGIVAMHTFPADGLYSFRLNVTSGVGIRLEDIDLSINGERIALLHYERGIERSIQSADFPLGADFVRSEPIAIKAGQVRLSAAFVRRVDGPYEDLIKPHDWSRAGNGTASTGTTEYPHMIEMTVTGPTKVNGVSETPTRSLIFSCRPTEASREVPCAEEIITRLATKAYRRTLDERDLAGLMEFYKQGAAAGGFEEGIRMALQATLASPHFVFRMESLPDGAKAGADYRVTDVDLASRLSFFLWGSLPDAELLALAERNRLSNPRELERQVKRMLASPKAEAMGDRFAAQWLRLQDIDKVQPDAFWFPDFDLQLANAMKTETQTFFNSLVKTDGSIFDFFTADYTFVNEALARHYGIPNVAGSEFRRVNYPDQTRRGLLGHGSILVQTSFANRTSPVLRGKWVMEVLMGNPPPPPPADVPDLEQVEETSSGKILTTRERMEIHRANAACRTCHLYMDPIGLALDNFDVTGRWRFRENGTLLDTEGSMYDGTPVRSPMDLSGALMKRPVPLVRAFTENLLSFAIGRRIEDFDQPTIRKITAEAEKTGYKMSSFVMGVVQSKAFQNRRADVTISDVNGRQ